MTPTETATILRQFNEWRRSEDETVEQPDPREIGEAIDAAIAMIERLEAAEKSDAESIAMYRKARDECAALRAKIARMEQQEPARLVTATAYRWRYRGAIKWQYGELTEEVARLAKEHNHEVQPLYATHGATGGQAMTSEEIIALAFQCGVWIPLASGPEREQTIDRLRRFAELVAAVVPKPR